MLAQKYGEDVGKAELAGLIHDCAKDLDKSATFALCKKYDIMVDSVMEKQPEVIHGKVGAFLARDLFGVECPEILAAVSDHTLGREDMDRLSSIVFVADYIEAGRVYPGVDAIRKASEISLEDGIVAGVDNTIEYILKKGGLLHPQIVLTRNWALLQLSKHRNKGTVGSF